MNITFKALILFVIASQMTLSVRPTIQEMLSKIRLVRPTTLQALNDIKLNIDDELKATEKEIKLQSDKASAKLECDLQELQKVKLDIENQIHDFVQASKDKASNTIKTTQEHLPSKEEIKEKTLDVKKSSKKAWDKFVDGVKKGPGKIKDFFAKIGRSFKKVKTAAAHYKVNEYQSNDAKKYCVVVTMPNFTEEQTRVAIHETSTGHYTLKIVAQAENAAVRKIMAKENNETNSESEQIISSTFFEGKHRNLSYHDGKLEVTVDLPRDVKAHTYELEFADHALKIEFERDEAKS